MCLDLETALKKAEADDFDVAILDYNLGGRTVLPVADTLQRKGIPFVFNTAMAEFEDLSARYNGALVCRKPANEAELVELLVKLTAEQRAIAAAWNPRTAERARRDLLQSVQVQPFYNRREGWGDACSSLF